MPNFRSCIKSSLSLMTVASVFLVSIGCSKTTPSGLFKDLDEGLGIFSNREQTADHFIAVVKLKTPALLDSAPQKDGKILIDQEQAKIIQAEQVKAIFELKKLSEEVQVLFRYKMVLNGLAISAPISLKDKIKGIGNLAYLESDGYFGRAVFAETNAAAQEKQDKEDLKLANSVKWIGADKLHAENIKGRGVKVGIIDTGIDYTHAMLGGVGTEAAYKAVDPSQTSILFPNKKVVGGIDLVGTEFDAASADYEKRIPHADDNPLDESGHGTHVAGTVAGVGDGENTYDGVAPEAELYAIKVFGAKGSTSDCVVIAGLEYAADPTGKGTGEGRLDVVNMSLGSSYGNPHILYSEAIKNLVQGGTITVASAGNEGAHDYIVGAPSVADEAISVAASIDNAAHNWKFSTVKFITPSAGALLAEAIEGSVTKPIQDAGDIHGKLIFVGLAADDFPQELKNQIKGNVAFMERGKVTFADKIRRAAEAGAIGVVVANNQAGDAFIMGGEGKFEIPSVMITQALGDNLKVELKKGDVTILFKNADKIEKPALIDTITTFSSKGPRTQDGILKPEITAPGANIISAAMGKGKVGISLSGTSMSGPHITGVMALLRQVHPDLAVSELKSLVMGRAVTITDEKKQIYPVSRQGAGRVQADAAAHGTVVASKASLSFGEQNIESKKMLRDRITIKNISKSNQEFQVVFEGTASVRMIGPATLSVEAGKSADLGLSFVLDASQMKESVKEFDGWVKLLQNNQESFRIPMLATVRRVSQLLPQKLAVHSTSLADSVGAAVDLTIKNTGINPGRALLFNLLGKSPRKADPTHDQYKNRGCDLESAGYRLIEKTVDGQVLKVLQVAAKLYEPMTTWNNCELSVLIDSNKDDQADQELALIALGNVKGLSNGSNDNAMASVLLDAGKAREIRKKFELASKTEKDPKKELKEDYSPAVVDAMKADPFNHSTVVVVEADITKLARTPTGEIAVKIATIHNEPSSVQMDDFLFDELKNWKKISLEDNSQAYKDLPEGISIKPGDEQTFQFTKGEGYENLLILMPDNRSVISDTQRDSQGMVIRPTFGI